MTRWTQHGTDSALKLRVTDIQTWKQSLTKTLQNTEDEIRLVSLLIRIYTSHERDISFMQLTECKERCEWALEVKRLPHEVVMECLALREQRSNIDLVADVTEFELKKVHV